MPIYRGGNDDHPTMAPIIHNSTKNWMETDGFIVGIILTSICCMPTIVLLILWVVWFSKTVFGKCHKMYNKIYVSDNDAQFGAIFPAENGTEIESV